ncbi:hypothetical protein DNTS_016499 [Danionella cerebrum]|uniref:Uncharacterized protein n=1 Tax=Danionella cerebrum TaxID=2873325 RepID=A0A553PRA3_9TELE|nr:hypothetical protein DNTS_003429 [Danionella translucida]TRZ02084.1 hypothetical protein DNTS_016499 [Danionella translucida]
MLGEAFLHFMNHDGKNRNHDGQSTRHSSKRKNPHDGTTGNTKSSFPQTPQTLRDGRTEEKPRQCRASVPSIGMPIHSCRGEDRHRTATHCSWCCPSFYKDYPDLRLAGDRLEHWSSHDLLDVSDEGPLLQSQDLSSLEPSLELNQPPDSGTLSDEEYLVMKSNHSSACEKRLTNSMLNGYLEVQMLEVFCQHMQNMACCGSSLLGPDVMPALVPTSVGVAKELTANQEEELDSSSGDAVRYLSTCSAPATSHFSSPVLRISEVD